MSRVPKLTDRQIEVLTWIRDDCPPRDWPDETQKNTARALASRGLAYVSRKKKVWAADITEAGAYYLTHGQVMPRPDEPATVPEECGRSRSVPSPDATVRQMRRVAARKRPAAVKQTKRAIKETYLRYKVVVTRLRVVEHFHLSGRSSNGSRDSAS